MLTTERVRVERGRNKDKTINSLPVIETCTSKVINRKNLQGRNKFILTLVK